MTHYAALMSAEDAWFISINAMLIMDLSELCFSMVAGFNMQEKG